MSEANEGDFLFLEEDKKTPNNSNENFNSKELVTEFEAILIDEIEGTSYDYAGLLSKSAKISFNLSIFCCLCFTIYLYDIGASYVYFETSFRYYFFAATLFFPLSALLYLISLIISPKIQNNPITDQALDSEIIEAEKIDSSLSSSIGGVWNAGWEVFGIDCPDCAIKISKSLNSLKGIKNTKVSITTGLVDFEIDLEIQNLSKVNTILCDLGYAPNAKWWELVNVSSEKVQNRLDIDESKLIKRLNIQPGVLESRIDNEQIFIRLATKIHSDLTKEFQKVIDELVGQKIKLKPKGEEWGLRPDQKQLFDGLIGFFFLPIIYIIQSLTEKSDLTFNSIEYHLLYLIALPIIILSSRQLRNKSLESLKRSQLGFESLVSMAIFGAVLLQAWFEALLIIVLVAFANNLENSAIRKARDSMQGGLNRIPNDARLIEKHTSKIVKFKSLKLSPKLDGIPEPSQIENKVPVGLINIGDHIEVRTGEIIPIDGHIISGQGLVDKSALTGESLPQMLSKGDFIEAGLVLTRGPIIIETSATGENTRLSELINTTKKYQEAPTRIHSVLEVFTNIWVPLVLFGSIFMALILPESLINEGERFRIILLLWVTACPCALLICAPIPHAISISMASNKAIIAKGGDVLEKIAKVNLALLDKTGTLTEGKPQITKIIPTKGSRLKTIIGISAGLELSSNHPYASVIIDKALNENITPYKIKNLIDGDGGISGIYNDEKVAIGNKKWVENQGFKIPNELIEKLNEIETTGISILTKGNEAIAAFGFASDSLNPNSSKLIHSLNQQNIKVELLSGDNQESVNKTATDLGIPVEICRGGLTPEQKVNWVEQRSITHITLMAGDGFNDAAAMAKADVGISVGNKEQLNLDAADVMIPSERPDLISSLCELSKKTRSVVIQNLVISITLTLILVLSVLSGQNDKIWLNVLAHEFSVLIVILNAMKLGAYKFSEDLNSEDKEGAQYNPFSIIIKIVKELYDESKEVIQIILKNTL